MRNSEFGFVTFPDGEVPPPSALAGRRVVGEVIEKEKPRGRIGKSILSVLYRQFDRNVPSDKGEFAGQPAKQERRKTVMYDVLAMGNSPRVQGRPDVLYRQFNHNMPSDKGDFTGQPVKQERRKTDMHDVLAMGNLPRVQERPDML